MANVVQFSVMRNDGSMVTVIVFQLNSTV